MVAGKNTFVKRNISIDDETKEKNRQKFFDIVSNMICTTA